ncbi:hypothetical protein HY640_05120 [Candidatus Woesearchaeota archaeon]|nr:hypothetical protein [Candidatus Woesearchaeota archaeon]
MVSESAIRDAFSKVKSDIEKSHRLVSSLQKELDAVRERYSAFADRKEFYDFIAVLDSRLQELESSLASRKALEQSGKEHAREHEKLSKSMDKSLDSLKAEISRSEKKRDELSAQVKEFRSSLARLSSLESRLGSISSEVDGLSGASDSFGKLRSDFSELRKKFASLDSRVSEVPDFSRVLGRLDELEGRISEARSMFREADVKELRLELVELTSEFAKLGKTFVRWSDLSRSEKRLDGGIEGVQESLKEVSSRLDSLKSGFVASSEFKESFGKLDFGLKGLRKSVDELLKAEVDLSDYVDNSQLRQSISEVRKELQGFVVEHDKKLLKHADASDARIREVSAQVKDLSGNVEILSTRTERGISELSSLAYDLKGREAGNQKELKSLRSEVSELKSRMELVQGVQDGLRSVSTRVSSLESRQEPVVNYRRSRSDLGSYITAFVVILVLAAAAYYAYLQIGQGSSNVTSQPSQITTSLGNFSVSQNYSQQNVSVGNVSGVALTDQDCVARFECFQDSAGRYDFNCYFDAAAGGCRCFKGGRSDCPDDKIASLSALRSASSNASNASSQSNVTGFAAASSLRLYLVALAAFIVFVLLLVYLIRKGEEADRVDRDEVSGEDASEEDAVKKRKR